MHLNELAHRAWLTAEEKGLHANLDGVTDLGAREQALLALAPLFLAVTDILQVIKKYGISLDTWDSRLFDMESTLCTTVDSTFARLLSLCNPHTPLPLQRLTDRRPATALRLLLVGTEVGEALELVQDGGAGGADCAWDALHRELSDILIRVGDLAHGLEIDLDHSVALVLAANEKRPYQYGTPGEHRP